MAKQIGKLTAVLTAQTSPFAKGMKSAAGMLGVFSSSATKVAGVLGSLRTAGIAAAGALAAAAPVVLIRAQAEAIDQLAKTADALGITTQALAGLRHHAGLAGAESQILDKGLAKLNYQVGQAVRGSTSLQQAFALLGLDAEKLAGMSVDQQFLAVADGFEAVPDPAMRARLAMQLFGEEMGVKLLNSMRGGSAAIREGMEEAEKLGLAFTRVDAAKVEAANDAMSRLAAVGKGVAQTLTIELAPYIASTATKLTEMAASGEGMGSKVVAAVEWVTVGVAKMADVIDLSKLAWIGVQKVGVGVIQILVWNVGQLVDSIDTIVQYFGSYLPDAMVEGSAKIRATIDGIGADLAAKQGELSDRAMDILVAPSSAEKVEKFFADIRKTAQAEAEAIAANAAAVNAGAGDWDEMAAALAEVEANAKKVAGTLEDLQKRVDQAGMSDTQKTIDDLARLGATPEQLAKAEDLLKKIEAMDLTERLRDKAQSIVDGLKTPLERYTEQIADLEDLLERGLLTGDEFERAVAKARKELRDEGGDRRELSMIRAGTAEAQAFVFDARMKKQETIAERQLTTQAQMARSLKSIDQKVGAGDAGVYVEF